MNTCSAVLAVVFAFALAFPARAGKFFYDDFEDGSATDGRPVSWVPVPGWSTGTREVIDGSFVHTPAGMDPNQFEMVTDVEAEVYDDVSIRSQLFIEGACVAFIYARSTFVNRGVATNFEVHGSAKVLTEGSFTIALSFTNQSGFFILDEVNVARPDPLSDMHLQFDVMGDTMSLTGWADGEAQPTVPQLIADISGLRDVLGNKVTRGAIGVFALPFANGTRVSFRDFEVVPEPCSLASALLGATGLLALQRLRNLPK
jgi:hypothetical protein